MDERMKALVKEAEERAAMEEMNPFAASDGSIESMSSAVLAGDLGEEVRHLTLENQRLDSELTQLRGREEEATWLQRIEHACETERGVFMGMLEELIDKWQGWSYTYDKDLIIRQLTEMRDKIARR